MAIDNKNIPPLMFNLVVRILERLGIKLDTLFEGLDLSLEALANQTTRISFQQAHRMIRNAYQATSDPSLGLLVAHHINISDWGMMGYAISSCESLEESLKIGQRYSRVATRLTENTINTDENTFTMSSTPLFPVGKEEPFFIEEDLGGVIGVLHRYLGDSANPKEVHFRYSQPDYVEKYQEHFRCPVKFDCANNQIIWAVDDIKRPLPDGNPAARQLAIQQCELLIADDNSEYEIIEKVQARIVQTPGEFASINEVADYFHMSESTFRRALRDAGTTYQKLLNGIRQKMAVEYLTTSNLKLEDIAYLVGYSDLSNFRRAFKKWTGHAPRTYRQSKHFIER